MKKLLYKFLIVFLVFLGIYVLHPFYLQALGNWLVVSDSLEPADVIVVLGGETGERVQEAVKLYKRGYAPKLLMSGGPLAWRLSYAQIMGAQARYLGVSSKDIILEDQSFSTLDNAYYSLLLVRKNKFNKVIVVTSPSHTRRAKRVFDKYFSDYDIKLMVHPVPKSKFKLSKWWQRHEDTQRVFREYSSLFYYFLKGY